MTNFEKIFAEQLKTAVPHDGDYLKGRTIEQVIEERKHNEHAMSMRMGKNVVHTDEEHRISANHAIELFKNNVGGRMVFVMIIDNDKSQQIFSMFENDWLQFQHTHQYVDHPTSSIPRFNKI